MVSRELNSTGLLITTVLLSLCIMIGVAGAQQTHYITTENGFDRKGGDYKDYQLPTPNPQQCSGDCLSDPQCKAYTYVPPGIQGPKAKCWLKNSFQTRTPYTGMVSGVKVYIGGNTEHIALGGQFQDTFAVNQDRMGSDYQKLPMANANLGMCMDMCVNDQKCRAFTFVSPGIQGKDAMCWLKDSVPGPRTDNCCASGFKQ
jgi:hypothetical protein